MTEDNKDKINELYRNRAYKNSRQIVTATLNSNEPDFKADYLYPIPLRIIADGEKIEKIHPDLIAKFPTKVCKLSDRDIIKAFANDNKWVIFNGMRFRTDGVVLTILDPAIQEALGRDNNINNFEVAYKFTEEYAYTKVRDVEFYVSEFGFITPVLVVNDVILKGNTINRISLSNKERFDELYFSYGDDVKVLYDIIPYATRDEKCNRIKHGRKIEFIKHCPKCHSELDLDVVQVQCINKDCPSRVIGRILNYCSNLRMENIGYQTLESLHSAGLLKNGIRSLYKLKKKSYDIQEIDGFGKLKTKKIISEIESKRRLKDYDFFGSLGIEGMSIKTFESIFSQIKCNDFIDMILLKKLDLMLTKLITINGIGDKKAEVIVKYFRDTNNRVELQKLIFDEISIEETYGDTNSSKGKIIVTGFRPNSDEELYLTNKGWDVTDIWSNKAKYLVVPYDGYESSKVVKAKELNIKIITRDSIKKVD
jgi:DNA ligase (NAD+)